MNAALARFGAIVISLLSGVALAEGDPAAIACQACHGSNGLNTSPDIPNLAGQKTLYLASQLHAFKSGARKHDQMSIIAQGLSDEQMANVAAWYSSIKIKVEMPQ